MERHITQYATSSKPKLTYCGMEAIFALRNIAAMPANNLKAARLRAGLKQPAIAEALGVSVAQVSRWENGIDNIPSARLKAMASAYSSTVGELFGEDVAPEASTERPIIQMGVVLPSEPALTRMFAGHLRAVGKTGIADELAPLLARLLPGGLMQAQGLAPDQDEGEEIEPAALPPRPSRNRRGQQPPKHT
jgi:transcriptional regulator with XRE-family HTH domain